MAREHVTVSLSGDGGDELFGGYWRYFMGSRLWRGLGPVPAPMRRAVARGIEAVSPRGWDGIFRTLAPVVPRSLRVGAPGDRMHKLAGVLGARSAEAMYLDLNSHWRAPAEVVLGGVEPLTALTDPARWARVEGVVPRMMYLDLISYLPDDILVKVDRASMAVALEARAPYLDHEVAEFAWRIPLDLKLRDGKGKWILRNLLGRYVPDALFERPKMGFGVPIDSWLRGPLRDWAEGLLDERRLRTEGYFDVAEVGRKWREHLDGSRNWQYLLWDVLMFQAWREA
jgi:asparagine synthase (glutamine-hydrolysing)